jgi:prevent-host-death family protein
MKAMTAKQARSKLYVLIDAAAELDDPIQITGRRRSAVLVSAEDWRSIQETLFLWAMPGMRESIIKGMKTPLLKCSKTLKG